MVNHFFGAGLLTRDLRPGRLKKNMSDVPVIKTEFAKPKTMRGDAATGRADDYDDRKDDSQLLDAKRMHDDNMHDDDDRKLRQLYKSQTLSGHDRPGRKSTALFYPPCISTMSTRL